MRRSSPAARVLIPTTILLLSGCFGLFGGRPGQSGLSRKHVSSKEAPTSLIAIDNTRCLVTEEKFRNTPVGADVTCYWSSDRGARSLTGRDGTQSRAAPQREVSGKIGETAAKGAAAAPRAKKPND
ncbi:MAG: hypothetical protein ABI877_09875 [Gemmatimonadaceae bacterium]